MRLFGYYAWHSFINQIKKLFHTWVAIFLLVCVVFGAIVGIAVGIGASALDDALDDEPGSSITDVEEDEIDDEPIFDFIGDNALPVTELGAAAVIFAVLFFGVLSADKSGGQIFQMADVNLLFPSPRKPQSVLLFRMVCRLGGALVITLYLPNLVWNVGLPGWMFFVLLLTWVLLFAYSQLFSVLIYTVASTHERLKSRVRPALFGVTGALIAAFLYSWKSGTLDAYQAACAFFNPAWTRYIPVYGWLKGLFMFPMEHNWLGAALCFVALVAGLCLLAYLVWHVKADFYEDAMQRSAETAQAQQAAKEAAAGGVVKRKKDRGERLRRDGLTRGSGAAMYFYKAMYNRFRFAHLRVFTKTSETYLVVAIGVSAITTFGAGVSTIIPVALALTVMCFFRSLGNPLSTDIQQVSFRMVPESAHRKVLCSLLGGSLNCLLDLLPAFLVATVWMRANPFTALFWMLFAVSVDFYCANVGLFLDLSIPTGAGQMLKTCIQILFVYFGLMPLAGLIIVGIVLEMLPLFLALATAFSLGIGFIFFGVSPLFLIHGQK